MIELIRTMFIQLDYDLYLFIGSAIIGKQFRL